MNAQDKQIAETVGCSKCGVPAGQWCVTKDGWPALNGLHTARHKAYHGDNYGKGWRETCEAAGIPYRP